VGWTIRARCPYMAIGNKVRKESIRWPLKIKKDSFFITFMKKESFRIVCVC
jgi:hypothetical protein